MINRSEQAASRNLGSSLGSTTASAIDQMIRWPFWFTGAAFDLMRQGMDRMAEPTVRMMGNEPNGHDKTNGHDTNGHDRGRGYDWSSWASSTGPSRGESHGQEMSVTNNNEDLDLSGDDVKYVLWSILFNKPGYEAVLEPQKAEIVNYSADGSSFAAMKIAKFLEGARHGRVERPTIWAQKGYPGDTTPPSRRIEHASDNASAEHGWRIPVDDQKYIRFVYRVERRLPKEEIDVTRVERVIIERGTDTRNSPAS